ncbi:MAG TPA: hypothetical protein VJT71_21070 [Pyrinomonadaceae bacterium]|nr:hypothetical protein [Pyrinomonadaceae bacterium]
MKSLSVLLLALILASFNYKSITATPGMSSLQDPVLPLTLCSELPYSAIGMTAKRKATKTECNPAEARRTAFWAARSNALQALRDFCRGRTSRAEAEAACAAAGKVLVTTQPNSGVGGGMTQRPGGKIDNAVTAGSNQNARLCVTFDDLEGESQSTTQADGICIFDGGKRTIFTARTRARCGVQCL